MSQPHDSGQLAELSAKVLAGDPLTPDEGLILYRGLDLPYEARGLPWHQFEDLVDTGRDRLGHHLEISKRDAARR